MGIPYITASLAAAERALNNIQRIGEPKIPVRIKEQTPDLTGMKPEEREAAMLDYGRMEKADLAFEKEWGGYLIAKRTHDAVLRKAEDEVSRLRNSDPTLDDDVVEIYPKSRKERGRDYEYTPTYKKTQTLDAEEEKLFGVDHEWISGETGDIESAEETAARMKLWKWLEKSLEGGPASTWHQPVQSRGT